MFSHRELIYSSENIYCYFHANICMEDCFRILLHFLKLNVRNNGMCFYGFENT